MCAGEVLTEEYVSGAVHGRDPSSCGPWSLPADLASDEGREGHGCDAEAYRQHARYKQRGPENREHSGQCQAFAGWPVKRVANIPRRESYPQIEVVARVAHHGHRAEQTQRDARAQEYGRADHRRPPSPADGTGHDFTSSDARRPRTCASAPRGRPRQVRIRQARERRIPPPANPELHPLAVRGTPAPATYARDPRCT